MTVTADSLKTGVVTTSPLDFSPIATPATVATKGRFYGKTAGGRIEAHWLDSSGAEVQITCAGVLCNASISLALADLTDVTGKTGSGTSVVMAGNPTLIAPNIGTFVNATHDHSSTAQGGVIDHSIYPLLAGRSGSQVQVGGTGAGESYTIRATASGSDGPIIFQTDPTTERMRILGAGDVVINGTVSDGSRLYVIEGSGFAFTCARAVSVGESLFRIKTTIAANQLYREWRITGGGAAFYNIKEYAVAAAAFLDDFQGGSDVRDVCHVYTGDHSTATGYPCLYVGGGAGGVMALKSVTTGVPLNCTVFGMWRSGGVNYFGVSKEGSGSYQDLNIHAGGATVAILGTDGDWTFQPSAVTSGTPTILTITAPAHVTCLAGAEVIDYNFNSARTVSFTAGAIAVQRCALFQAPTYASAGAMAMTEAATVAITGAPSGGGAGPLSITNPYALWVQTGMTKLGGPLMAALKSGANQGAAGAAAGELWHDTDDDTVNMGV